METWVLVVLGVIAVLLVAGGIAVVLIKRRSRALPAAPPRRGVAAPAGSPDAADDEGNRGSADLAGKAGSATSSGAATAAREQEVTGTWPHDEPAGQEAAGTAAAGAEELSAPQAPVLARHEAGPPEAEQPEARAGRLHKLRARLAGSSSSFGRALLAVLSRDKLSEEDWDELEEALLIADVGAEATGQIIDEVRRQMRVENSASAARARELLREQLIAALTIDASRELNLTGSPAGDGTPLPGVTLVVGVNGSGKTTTIGRIARLAVADGTTCLLGAADTFRAAAAEQLTTWGERVGVEVVRGPEGSDPASVAFDAVKEGIARGVDAVIVDTAGRLQNKANLMAELGKIVKVASRQAPITETLLVLDATTGQNGLNQGRVFAEVAGVTGIVLTKLDGSAKGGIVIAVQRELGVPVKLVGIGEGPDDLAPFDPEAFVDALLTE